MSTRRRTVHARFLLQKGAAGMQGTKYHIHGKLKIWVFLLIVVLAVFFANTAVFSLSLSLSLLFLLLFLFFLLFETRRCLVMRCGYCGCITERMHLKVQEICGKQLLIFWEMKTGPVLHCCWFFFVLLLCIVVFFVLRSEACLIVVVVPLLPFHSLSCVWNFNSGQS